jgi:hypothetical protein
MYSGRAGPVSTSAQHSLHGPGWGRIRERLVGLLGVRLRVVAGIVLCGTIGG